MYEIETAAQERNNKNPMLLLNEDNWWESETVLNPATLYDGEAVALPSWN